MQKKSVKRIVMLIVTLAWIGMFGMDLSRVSQFEKPVFCVLINGADDGGSGTYVGLGYTVEIEGDFVTEDEMMRGVKEYDMKLFGIFRILAAIRC